jgi:hypothetical protein
MNFVYEPVTTSEKNLPMSAAVLLTFFYSNIFFLTSDEQKWNAKQTKKDGEYAAGVVKNFDPREIWTLRTIFPGVKIF